MRYNRPSLPHYRVAQGVSWLVSTLVFKRRILRNEIKGKEGAFVVIANHQAALDFVNLIGATKRPMSFVISNSIYNTLPIKGYLKKMGLIPKQQFQTTVGDMRTIKAVVDNGEPLVIYPAGLMCEDGLSTPIPAATYKFLKWLKADVYMAKSIGTYFVMPKWGKGMRPGRTYLDLYKLFSKEELEKLSVGEIKEKAEEALLFDAYREQETVSCMHGGCRDIRGLENVLYKCPHCGEEFSMEVRDKDTIYCTRCGFAEKSDAHGFLHIQEGAGEEIRYVSDWSRYIYNDLKDKVRRGEETEISSKCGIQMLDYKKNKYVDVGNAQVTLTEDRFKISGMIKGEAEEFTVSVKNVPTLPFGPGKYFEIQQGGNIYRCVPESRKLPMKVVNMVKIFCELASEGEKTQKKEKTT